MYLALLWHQHQPLYRDPEADGPQGSLLRPWVRLHALRDYYSMAVLAAERPDVRVTINLTPVLLEQLDDYVHRGRTDRALELTRTPSEALDPAAKDELLASFFDADWHNQIFPHPRYKELFERRQDGRPFDAQDLRDLRMWFNLAWFGSEFRAGPVELVTGERVTVYRFVEKGRGFDENEIREMVEDQYRIMRAVVPVHRSLQDAGRIEVTTTPFYHPILPLLIDSDAATLDRPGARLPERFAFPGDAREQVRRARVDYESRFGRPPDGMWPAEGAVSAEAVRLLGEAGARWAATDQGVLARSGRWGYRVDDPGVLLRPYRHESEGTEVALFFRHTGLSDRIGFDYQRWDDSGAASRDFVEAVKGLAGTSAHEAPIVTVALDGENAWGGYRDDGRPFLRALYASLDGDPEVRTVTFRDYLDGDPERGVPAHPATELERVHELFTGSWIDEMGSAPGVDLGTWAGEAEENRAWELLLRARREVERRGADSATHPAAVAALLAAEGSDWFWWFGEDQDSGDDAEFDELFRGHLRGVYAGLGLEPPVELASYIVRRPMVWTFAAPVERIRRGDTVVVRTNCPGVLRWSVDEGEPREVELTPAGGVMAGARRFHVSLGPFEAPAQELRFRFLCRHPGCSGEDRCCSPDERLVRIE